MSSVRELSCERLIDLFEAWVRKLHYEPCEEVILPYSYDELKDELVRRLQGGYLVI